MGPSAPRDVVTDEPQLPAKTASHALLPPPGTVPKLRPAPRDTTARLEEAVISDVPVKSGPDSGWAILLGSRRRVKDLPPAFV